MVGKLDARQADLNVRLILLHLTLLWLEVGRAGEGYGWNPFGGLHSEIQREWYVQGRSGS